MTKISSIGLHRAWVAQARAFKPQLALALADLVPWSSFGTSNEFFFVAVALIGPEGPGRCKQRLQNRRLQNKLRKKWSAVDQRQIDSAASPFWFLYWMLGWLLQQRSDLNFMGVDSLR